MARIAKVPRPAPRTPQPLERGLAGASILLVDDDVVLRSAVERVLVAAGARVLQASDGAKAISLASVVALDLLLTDMEMHDADGAEVASAVATLSPRVAVVFMSGRPREVHVTNGRMAADACFVEKPFSSLVLVDTLETLLASRHALTAS